MKITWHDGKSEPRCQPNPAYPNGIDLELAPNPGEPESCYVPLPYPARRIGHYLVECPRCGKNAVVTTAGRPDDPRSLTMSCGRRPSGGK